MLRHHDGVAEAEALRLRYLPLHVLQVVGGLRPVEIRALVLADNQGRVVELRSLPR